MKRFATHGVTFIVALMVGIAIGFYATWRMGEPERLAFKESQYFRVEMTEKVGEADALVEKLCDAIDIIEKAIGPTDVFIKLYGDDRTVAIGGLKPRPSKAD